MKGLYSLLGILAALFIAYLVLGKKPLGATVTLTPSSAPPPSGGGILGSGVSGTDVVNITDAVKRLFNNEE